MAESTKDDDNDEDDESSDDDRQWAEDVKKQHKLVAVVFGYYSLHDALHGFIISSLCLLKALETEEAVKEESWEWWWRWRWPLGN